MRKNKHLKFWSMGIGMTASLLGILLVTSLSSFTTNTSNDYSLINKNNQNIVRASVTPQPLSSFDGKITSPGIETGHISADEVIDDEGSYILTASSTNGNNAKVVKLNYQMQYLYDWTYNTNNYVTRQIVADTDDIGYYYALLVNNNISINPSGNSDDTFSVSNPAIVVQLYDTGSSFEQKNTYNLGLPNFHINDVSGYSNVVANDVTVNVNDTDHVAQNIWDHVYVQEAIQEEDDNSKLSMIRTTTTSNSTAQDTGTTDANVYINDDSKAVIYKMLGSDSKKENNSTVGGNDYYMLKQLYLNNANNMVYLKDQTTNKKMILLFGGNTYQSFWFYDFEVKVTNNASTQYVTALLYANYDFDPYNKQAADEYMYDSGTKGVKKDYYYLPFMTYNKISNLAWYVGGAKSIVLTNQKTNTSNSYVFLAMMQPNVTDFNAELITNSSVSEDVKKGTYGTPDTVTTKLTSFTSNGTNLGPGLGTDQTTNPAPTGTPAPQNTNPQNSSSSSSSYQNKDILISSSSINASYELLYANQGGAASDYQYPFSAIQSLTVLPVMTSEIASLIAITPQSSENDFSSINEKIYLNTIDNTTNINSKFALFNCIKFGNNFYRFNFAKKNYAISTSWIKDKKSISNVLSSNTLISIPVGQDYYGFSRILLNTNPENADGYISDGWNNSASQKIIAFSPQLTSNIVDSEENNAKFQQVAATLVIRGHIISFTYDFELISGVRLVPVANMDESFTSRIDPSSSSSSSYNGLNNFSKLLGINYLDNTWVLTYQANKKSWTYTIKYSKTTNYSWIVGENSTLQTTFEISKIFPQSNDNFIQIKSDKSISIVNTNNKSTLSMDDYSASILSNKEIWGTIEKVSNQELSDANLLSKTPAEIVNDESMLKQLVKYSGGWSVDPQTGKPTEEPLIINVEGSGSKVKFDVALKFINGIYYTSANFDSSKYPNVVQNQSLNIPSFEYDGFATLAPWVMPAIIGGTVFLVVVFITIGVLVTLSLHKNKKMMQKGFASSNKKIDTLTTAVGSVYQKILTQTKNNKQPQMLKAATKPKPGATPAPKPAGSPAPKPSAPSAAPKKPA